MGIEHVDAEVLGNRKAHFVALRVAAVYAAAASTWIVVSDRLILMLGLSPSVVEAVNTGKGLLFVAVTATVVYVTTNRSVSASYREQERYRVAQEALRDRERAIRQAYIEVLDAVTGGRLILMWPDDLRAALGEIVMPLTLISRPDELSRARRHLTDALEFFTPHPEDWVLAANEGIANTLKHAGHGEYGVRRTPNRVQIVIMDLGPGIDFCNLPKATLVPGFSTKASLGMGFTIMLEVADRVRLATEPGLTMLVLEFELEPSTDGPTCERN